MDHSMTLVGFGLLIDQLFFIYAHSIA